MRRTFCHVRFIGNIAQSRPGGIQIFGNMGPKTIPSVSQQIHVWRRVKPWEGTKNAATVPADELMGAVQETKKRLNAVLRGTFHRGILKGARNISDTLSNNGTKPLL